MKETPETVLILSAWGGHQELPALNPGRASHQLLNLLVDASIVDLPASRTVRKKCLGFVSQNQTRFLIFLL